MDTEFASDKVYETPAQVMRRMQTVQVHFNSDSFRAPNGGVGKSPSSKLSAYPKETSNDSMLQKCAHAVSFIAEMARCKVEFLEDINYLAHCRVGEVIN